MDREIRRRNKGYTFMMAHLCVPVYDHLQGRGSISWRKLAFHLRLQEFPGQTNHPGARFRRYGLDARQIRRLSTKQGLCYAKTPYGFDV